MNIQIEVVGPCRKQINIEVPSDKTSAAYDAVVDGYKRFAKIDGFRAGKAPVDLIKRRYQKEILKEVKERLIPAGYQAALQNEKLNVVNVIDVTETDPVEGKPYAFQITVDVFPEFDVPDYKSIRIEEKPAEVTDEGVEEVVDRMRDRMATFEDVKRKAEKADRVMVTYSATVDGQPMSADSKDLGILAKAENFGVILDPEYSFIPEFVDGLVGASAGETKTIEVNFDEKFVEKSLAGKKAVYTVSVIGVQEKILPEVTPEFLKSLGVESIESMRERIRTDLLKMKQSQEERRIQDDICKKLLEDTVMNLPDSVIQRRTAEEVYDMVEYNADQGIPRDTIEQNRDQIFAAAAKTAEEKTKIRYILLKIAEKENLTASAAEIEAFIRSIAMKERKDPAKVKENLQKNNRMGDVREDLLASKALKYLVEIQKPQTTTV